MPLVQYNNAMHGEERKRGGGSGGGGKQEYSNGSGDGRRRDRDSGWSVSSVSQFRQSDSTARTHAAIA
jgi:hypothetical protein